MISEFQPNIDAIAHYGSVVRGDSDHLSDRDLLLVSNDDHALRLAKTSFTARGYSCACYNWSKLRFLASRNALFIQHLKQESTIVWDKDSMLQSVFDSYAPAPTYSKSMEGARNMVSLTKSFPDSPKGIGWALDVLAVGFRNLAILTLANEGRYVFSFSDLLSGLQEIDRLNERTKSTLLRLREYKSNYRKKDFASLPSREIVFEVQKVIGECFDVSFHSNAISEESFHQYALYANSLDDTAQWYLRARLFEGAFLTLNSPRILDKKTLTRFRAVEEALENPACYSALFSDSAEYLRQEVIYLSRTISSEAA